MDNFIKFYKKNIANKCYKLCLRVCDSLLSNSISWIGVAVIIYFVCSFLLLGPVYKKIQVRDRFAHKLNLKMDLLTQQVARVNKSNNPNNPNNPNKSLKLNYKSNPKLILKSDPKLIPKSNLNSNPKLYIIPIYYADAQKTAAILQQLVLQNSFFRSDDGGAENTEVKISSDARTNQLILYTDQAVFNKLKNIIDKLDTKDKQILIEARIVEINENAYHELGWSLSQSNLQNLSQNAPQNPPQNSLQNSMNSLAVHGFIKNNIINPNSGIGLVVKHFANQFMLDLQLQALESKGEAKVISKPHLIVTDNHQAHIQQGQEVPYQVMINNSDMNSGNKKGSSESYSSQVQFKKVLLSLSVTPRVTKNNNLTLDLVINKDQLKADGSSLGNIPLIDTREIKTQVQVESGDTLLLGGILEKQDIDSVSKVPWLSDLPGVGDLFKSKRHSSSRNEVVIFITPKVID